MKNRWSLLAGALGVLGAVSVGSLRGAEVESVGPFFEPGFPFFHTAVDLRGSGPAPAVAGGVVVRGILLPLADGSTVLFDQELLRVAAWWRPASGAPPVTLRTMAQASYAEPHRKTGTDLPKPTSPLLLVAGAHPGMASSLEEWRTDPRPAIGGNEQGRGPLPEQGWRFGGVEMRGAHAVLHYRCGDAEVKEWHESADGALLRHFEISPHVRPLLVNCGAAPTAKWERVEKTTAVAGEWMAAVNGEAVSFRLEGEELVAELPPAKQPTRWSVRIGRAPVAVPPVTPPLPPAAREGRWPEVVETKGQLDAVRQGGLTLDRLALPLENPWKRRVRSADLVFLSAQRGAMVTFDGDVWLVDGLNEAALAQVRWRRFASGLNEPLSIAVVGKAVQVWTRNGVVRLWDRDGNGEADWYENFSDVVVQSQHSRTFPLDMDVAADGGTYLSQGGALQSTAAPIYAGAVTRLAPDGRSATVVATRGREPYVAVHPKTGMLTGTDQQGNYVPSSACYLVRPGDNFGYGEAQPAKLTPPLVWIPHTEDNSCASQVWLLGDGLGALNGNLMHLSYGRGLPFLICPDLDAPVPQGAVIPLPLPTDLPLLQGRMHPGGQSVWVCGFQIYDSRTKTNWGLGRIRLSGDRLTAPVQARSNADGVILTFASPLDPATVTPERVTAAAWNYQRTPQYGSPRFNLSGLAGVELCAIGQVVLSRDRKSVFIHLPGIKPVMQLEVQHEFALATREAAVGKVYFTIHQPHPEELAAAGFPGVDLSKSVPLLHTAVRQMPTVELGKTLSESLGCVACHSIDGSMQGKTGPTWKGLFGQDRTFTDGSVEPANETYLRISILDPQKKTVKGFQPGMQSYRGVISEDQLESLILYIRSLQ